MPHGVIFDMDGVLVDSGAPHHESWRVTARKHGINFSDDRFKETFGKRSIDIIHMIWGKSVSAAEAGRLDAEKEAIYRDLITGRVPLMPGCVDALRRLHDAGLKLAVGTSGPPENLELVLDEGGIRPFFAATVNGHDIAKGKPAPDCFLLAAERLGLPAADCIVVEDAPVGIEAGVAAGIPVIALAGTHPTEPLQTAGATTIVDHMDEITPALVYQLKT